MFGSLLSAPAAFADSAPDGEAPSAPTDLGYYRGEGREVHLFWSASSDNIGVAEYTIERDGEVIGSRPGPDANTFVDDETMTIPEGPHAYAVFAEDAAGNRGPAAQVEVLVDNQLPSTPSGLSASLGKGGVQLNWEPSTDNFPEDLSYFVFRDGGIIEFRESSSYLDPSPPPGHHTYQIQAADGAGNWSPFALSEPVEIDVPRPVLGAPGGLSAVDEEGRVHLSWSPVAAPGGGYVYYTVERDGEIIGQNINPRFLDLRASGGRHTYQVFAEDDEGHVSQPSEGLEVEVSAVPLDPPVAPTDLYAYQEDGQVHLRWTPPADYQGVLRYVVVLDGREQGESEMPQLNDGRVPTGPHTYAVLAEDRDGRRSPLSKSFEIDVDSDAPSAPTDFSVRRRSGNILVLWAPSTDNVGVVAYTLLRDGQPFAVRSGEDVTAFTDTQILSPGRHVYSIFAEDVAGNVGPDSWAEITIDSESPTSGSAATDPSAATLAESSIVSGGAENATVGPVGERQKVTPRHRTCRRRHKRARRRSHTCR